MKCKRNEPVFAFVYGEGAFPMDMLRYDTCWPAHGTDVMQLDAREYRGVCLGRHARERNDPGWTTERWESFGWTVKECER